VNSTTDQLCLRHTEVSDVRGEDASVVLHPVGAPPGYLRCLYNNTRLYHEHEEDVVTLHPHSLTGRQHKKAHGEAIAAMVEQLTQWRAALGPSGLLAVNGIQSLIQEDTHSSEIEGPRGDYLAERVVVI
jgi:hypothetical protein